MQAGGFATVVQTTVHPVAMHLHANGFESSEAVHCRLLQRHLHDVFTIYITLCTQGTLPNLLTTDNKYAPNGYDPCPEAAKIGSSFSTLYCISFCNYTMQL